MLLLTSHEKLAWQCGEVCEDCHRMGCEIFSTPGEATPFPSVAICDTAEYNGNVIGSLASACRIIGPAGSRSVCLVSPHRRNLVTNR